MGRGSFTLALRSFSPKRDIPALEFSPLRNWSWGGGAPALRGSVGQTHSEDLEAVSGSVLGAPLEVHWAASKLLTNPACLCAWTSDLSNCRLLCGLGEGAASAPWPLPSFFLLPCLPSPTCLPLLPASSSQFPDSFLPFVSCLELLPCIPTSMQRCPIATQTLFTTF